MIKKKISIFSPIINRIASNSSPLNCFAKKKYGSYYFALKKNSYSLSITREFASNIKFTVLCSFPFGFISFLVRNDVEYCCRLDSLEASTEMELGEQDTY